MRTERELLIACIEQFNHISKIAETEPLSSTECLTSEINQALGLASVKVSGANTQTQITKTTKCCLNCDGRGTGIRNCYDCDDNYSEFKQA